MTILKNIQRLSWRFTSKKPFQPNKEDVDALNFIISWINREKEQEIQDNTIFAKMYIYCFIHELHFYKDLKFAQKKLGEVLTKPLPDLYEDFLKRLNDFELEKFMKQNGLDKQWVDDDKLAEQHEAISESQEQLKTLVLGKWSKEQVDMALNNQVSEAINRYKNLP